MKQCKWYHLCPIKRYTEEGRLENFWVNTYCKGDWQNCVRYEMEEKRQYHPDWMLPDGSVDESLKKKVRVVVSFNGLKEH